MKLWLTLNVMCRRLSVRIAHILILTAVFCLFGFINHASSYQSGKPVKIAIISTYADLMPEALKEFEKKHGSGLIQLSISDGNNRISPDKIANADVVFVYHVNDDVYGQYATAVSKAVSAGARIIASPKSNPERFWKLKQDDSKLIQCEQYWSEGGTENLVSLLTLLYIEGGGKKKIPLNTLTPQIKEGIWHHRASKVFSSLADYLSWYRSQQIVAPNAALVTIHFLPHNYKVGDIAHIRALTNQLEKAGIGVVPAFAYPLSNISKFISNSDGTPATRMILSLNMAFLRPTDGEELKRYGIPVMNLLATRESLNEWKANDKGLLPGSLSRLIVTPEHAGATEPILIATAEISINKEGYEIVRLQPITERIEAVVKRTKRWLTLQEKPNADKRIALIYYNNPPGKGNLGASYLNLMPSLLSIIERLKKAGYKTGLDIPDEKQLIQSLELLGRNVELWAPGELDKLSKSGVSLWPIYKYKQYYKSLPEEFRTFVEENWGKPEDSTLMTVTLPNGERAFVMPGMHLGNLYLGPQALRSTFERSTSLQHDPKIPPPHSYIASYLWYRYEFKADAIVHVGRHGTLEWLPGKSVAQAGHDSSEVLLGDLPDPYYYIIDGDAEALQAKRRGAAVLIGHLTPLNVRAGEHSEYEALHKINDQYEKTKDESPITAEEYKKQIKAKTLELKIDKHLGINLDNTLWGDFFSRLHTFLHEIEEVSIPIGQHTIGVLPTEKTQREALEELIRSAFMKEELPLVEPYLTKWANALFEKQPVAPPSDFSSKLREKAEKSINDGRVWIENLYRSPQMEIDALVNVLAGKFIPSGIEGDPLRSPSSLPSGRNLHDFDPALIPTKAAWEAGKRLAKQTIDQFKTTTGKYPEKISLVMWSGDTGRSQGVMEAEALYLLGVEPQWNSRNQMDGLRLLSDSELERPRVDIVLTISGLYRDTLPDKVIWLDRAVRLAALAQDKYENFIRKHDLEIATLLKTQGMNSERAEIFAKARAFSQAPGAYGTGGIEKIVEQSKDKGKGTGLAEAYLYAMNHAYSEKVWGQSAPKVLDHHLKGNQLIIHSRASNLYGITDNDDVYQYMGGLNMATKSVNDGVAPEMLINNLRQVGNEKIETFRNHLVKELSTRLWNKKWIEGQMTAGYSGARQFAKDTEYLYGWQATSPEQMNGSMWQETFDVYVADKHGVKIDDFFSRNNPHAQQWQLARLLEVDHQGTYKFSDADRTELIKRYVKSVAVNGVACSANTCGNQDLHKFISQQASLVEGVSASDLSSFNSQMQTAIQPITLSAISGLIQGLGTQSTITSTTATKATIARSQNSTSSPGHRSNNIPNKSSSAQIVSGYAIKEKSAKSTKPVVRSLPITIAPFIGIAALLLTGLYIERRRRRR